MLLLPPIMESPMNEEQLNLSMRKFLKTVGVGSQREIEHAVARELASGGISGNQTFPAFMTLEVPGLKLTFRFEGEIRT